MVQELGNGPLALKPHQLRPNCCNCDIYKNLSETKIILMLKHMHIELNVQRFVHCAKTF